MFKNFGIGARLGAGYAVAVVLTIIVTIAGVAGMNRVFHDLEEVTQRRVPNMVLLFDMIRSIESISRSIRNIALTDDARENERNMKSIVTARGKLEKDITDLDKRLQSDTADKMLQAIKEQHVKYLAEESKFEKLLQDGKKAEAVTHLREGMREVQVELRKRVDAMSDYQEKQVERAYVDGKTAFERGRWVLLLVTLAVIATSTLFAVLITRGISLRVNEAMHATERVAAGDLAVRVVSTSRDELGQLLSALERMRTGLAGSVGTIRTAAIMVRDGSQEIAKGNSNLSTRTEQQASSIEETASTMEALTTAVKENADGVKAVSEMAHDASEIASTGVSSVQQVVDTMTGISESSRKIADIIGVIDGIAFQTNILALNAAVEAARAGEQGRGFAVVAGEVRNLAQRSAEAAREIKSLIQDSVARVQAGTQIAGNAGKSMDDIIQSVQAVSRRMNDIATANDQQMAGIEQVNSAVIQMEQMVQQSAALVEESAASAEEMAGQADALAEAVARFKLDSQFDDSRPYTHAAKAKAAPRPAAPEAHRRMAAGSGTTPLATASVPHALPNKRATERHGDGDWKEF